ncbi:MAG TPA: hypothetical protein VKU82_10535 [Planctomycetaceae bacterium]|nr:hypothetical protein [Planctomycetaceae bacterium]
MPAHCEQRSNQFDRTFQIFMSGQEYSFESFQSAISALAQCGIIGEDGVKGAAVSFDSFPEIDVETTQS